MAARSHDYNILGQLPFLVSAAFWTLPSEEGALSGALEAMGGCLLGQAERMMSVVDRVIWARDAAVFGPFAMLHWSAVIWSSALVSVWTALRPAVASEPSSSVSQGNLCPYDAKCSAVAAVPRMCRRWKKWRNLGRLNFPSALTSQIINFTSNQSTFDYLYFTSEYKSRRIR